MADKYIPRSKALYDAEIAKAMTEKFGYKNVMEVPRIEKITTSVADITGTSRGWATSPP